MTTRIACAALAGTAALAVLAGCGQGTPTAAPPGTGSHGSSSTHALSGTDSGMDSAMSDMAGMAGMDETALWAVQKSGGAVMVTDGEGRPLYRSDADAATPPRSVCTGPCTTEWEPVTVPAGQSPDLLGVSRSAVGSLHRADGTTQLTLGGWPLYRHAGPAVELPDTRAYTGRGWFVVTPGGDRLRS